LKRLLVLGVFSMLDGSQSDKLPTCSGFRLVGLIFLQTSLVNKAARS